MRQILIDELDREDMVKLEDYLIRQGLPSSINGLYWLEMPLDLLDQDQRQTVWDHPFGLAIEIGESWVKFEFLIRSRSNMNSLLTRYASIRQQWFILDYATRLIDQLHLRT